MSIEIQGLNTLIKKLDKVSRIESKKAVEEVASIVEQAIRGEASSFSQAEAKYISKCDARNHGTSYFVDIGLKNDQVDFELWKGLYYHQWGYWNKGWNFTGQYYIGMHQMWFDRAVQSIGVEAEKKLKAKLKAEIKAAMR